jgi:hypothetical protein
MVKSYRDAVAIDSDSISDSGKSDVTFLPNQKLQLVQRHPISARSQRRNIVSVPPKQLNPVRAIVESPPVVASMRVIALDDKDVVVESSDDDSLDDLLTMKGKKKFAKKREQSLLRGIKKRSHGITRVVASSDSFSSILSEFGSGCSKSKSRRVRRKKASSQGTASSDSFSSADSDTSMNGRGLKTAGLSDNNGCEI